MKLPHFGARAHMRGFTLIELMIAVAVVAILASIAIPSYNESVRKGRRGDAKALLVEAAQVMERHRTVNDNTYLGTVQGLPAQSPRDGTAHYVIAIADRTASTFRLTATPTSAAQSADRCGVLSITHTGAKRHSIGTDAECGFGTTGS